MHIDVMLASIGTKGESYSLDSKAAWSGKPATCATNKREDQVAVAHGIDTDATRGQI